MPIHHRRSLLLATLALGASCAAPGPATPAAPAPAPTSAPAARATGRPEIRYYEISAA